MRPDESDSGSEGSRGGFGGIDSPPPAGGSDAANVWKLEEDAADDAAKEAYKLKLTAAREAWENEMDKEDAAARRRGTGTRQGTTPAGPGGGEDPAGDGGEVRAPGDRTEEAAKRREEEAEVEATALEKEATERKAKAEEMMREAAEKIADAKSKSAAAAALVADAEKRGTRRSAPFGSSTPKRAYHGRGGGEDSRGDGAADCGIASKLDAEREELKKQIAAAAEKRPRPSRATTGAASPRSCQRRST